MPTFDPTAAVPGANSGAQTAELAGQQAEDTARITSDTATQNQYMQSVYTQRTLPQLQSSIGANGQWYSGARQNAEKFSAQDFLKGTYDVNSAAQRQLDDLTRQRMYATLGLIA